MKKGVKRCLACGGLGKIAVPGWMRNIRKQYKWNLTLMAKKVNTSVTSLSMMERGLRYPTNGILSYYVLLEVSYKYRTGSKV